MRIDPTATDRSHSNGSIVVAPRYGSGFSASTVSAHRMTARTHYAATVAIAHRQSGRVACAEDRKIGEGGGGDTATTTHGNDDVG